MSLFMFDLFLCLLFLSSWKPRMHTHRLGLSESRFLFPEYMFTQSMNCAGMFCLYTDPGKYFLSIQYTAVYLLFSVLSVRTLS